MTEISPFAQIFSPAADQASSAIAGLAGAAPSQDGATETKPEDFASALAALKGETGTHSVAGPDMAADPETINAALAALAAGTPIEQIPGLQIATHKAAIQGNPLPGSGAATAEAAITALSGTGVPLDSSQFAQLFSMDAGGTSAAPGLMAAASAAGIGLGDTMGITEGPTDGSANRQFIAAFPELARLINNPATGIQPPVADITAPMTGEQALEAARTAALEGGATLTLTPQEAASVSSALAAPDAFAAGGSAEDALTLTGDTAPVTPSGTPAEPAASLDGPVQAAGDAAISGLAATPASDIKAKEAAPDTLQPDAKANKAAQGMASDAAQKGSDAAGQNMGQNNGQNAGQNAGQNTGQNTSGGQAGLHSSNSGAGQALGQQAGPASDMRHDAAHTQRSQDVLSGLDTPAEALRAKEAPQAPLTPERLAGWGDTRGLDDIARGLRGEVGRDAGILANRSNPSIVQNAANQMNMALTRAVEDGETQFTLRLNPAELGRVTVKMNFLEGGGIRAQVMVQNPETLEMLQRDLKGLERAVEAGGGRLAGAGIEMSLDKGDQESAGRAMAEAMMEEKMRDDLAAMSAPVTADGDTDTATAGAADGGASMAEHPDGTDAENDTGAEDVPLDDILPYVSVDSGVDIHV